MKTISMKVPKALDAQITAAARRSRRSRSDLLREAVTSYLERTHAPRKGSALELAGDLVGSVEGPGDLSWNKKYMRGYGR
jgi:predicted transcriptional regulator